MIFLSIEEPAVRKGQFTVMAPGAAEDTLKHAWPEFQRWPVSGNTCWLNKAVLMKKRQGKQSDRHRNFEMVIQQRLHMMDAAMDEQKQPIKFFGPPFQRKRTIRGLD